MNRVRAELEKRQERGDVYAPECPSRALLDHVTSRWGLLVLVVLLDSDLRFGELSSLIGGVSDKMLSQTLKTLVADGFITRTVTDDTPVKVTYSLTPAGQGAGERLAELVEWLEANVGSLTAAAQ